MPTNKHTRKRLLEALKSKLKRKLAAKMQEKRTRRAQRKLAPVAPVAPVAAVAPVAHAPIVAPLVAPIVHASPKVSHPRKRSMKSPSLTSIRHSMERNLPLAKSMQSLRASVKHLVEANAALEVKSTRQKSQRKGHSVAVIPSDIY